MSTLYIRLPSKANADNALPEVALECPFALASDGGAIEREGSAALASLGEIVAKVQRVVVLLAAGDVTLLQLKVPPLSTARLKAALPSLVEEQLMSDPADCVLVAGAADAEGMRTIGVVHRVWLEHVFQTLLALGARTIAALPSQLCLPCEPDTVSAAIADGGLDIDLAIRLSQHNGIGMVIMPTQPDTAAQDVVAALQAVVPIAPVALYVPQTQIPAYQAVLETAVPDERIKVFADNWPRWIAGARTVRLNMAAGLGAAASPGLHWQRWRWPLVLAALALLINVLGLNIDWLRMKRESAALRAGMIQTYKTAYPKETAIIDPILQMRQKIVASQHAAGQAAPDDFIALASAFGEIWQNAMQGSKPGIATLDYNERSLLVSLKSDGAVSAEQLKQIKTALAAHNLSMTEDNPGKWQIRSAK